jgi:DNA-binding response OmpR family regulator
VAETPIANSTILAVFPAWNDRTALFRIFARSNWELTFARDFRETQIALRESLPGCVISDYHLLNGYCWTELLQEIRTMEEPPPLVVANHFTDDRLWAEVLNLGADDFLVKPFDGTEVLHVVSTACRRSEYQRTLRSGQRSLSMTPGQMEVKAAANSPKAMAAACAR